MENTKKVAYKGDGTEETGNKIKARLIEMGGDDELVRFVSNDEDLTIDKTYLIFKAETQKQ
jgi:hypothetical protein